MSHKWLGIFYHISFVILFLKKNTKFVWIGEDPKIKNKWNLSSVGG